MCSFSQSKLHVLPTQRKLPAAKNNIFLHAMGFGASIFFPCLVNIFNILIFSFLLLILLTYFLFHILFFYIAEYDKEQDWIMETMATCRQNIENEIELLMTCFSPLIPEDSCKEPVTAHISLA